MIDYDEFQAEVRRLKRERWAKILPPNHRGGCPGAGRAIPSRSACW